MLLHQVFSFNSPVWFNVGTTSPQQVSACFILSVDDTMDSILNWYREEGLIFKGGSGAGLNLSRIRSSKELLSSGGTASGPVSRSCAAPTPAPAPSSPAAPPGGPRRWSCSTSTTPTSRSSSRPRPRRRTRSGCCATPASTWTSAARTSSRCSTRTRTTRCGSPTSSCARSRPASQFGLRARQTGEVIETVDATRAVRQDHAGRVGVRRPRHPVRRHDQRLAHQPGDRAGSPPRNPCASTCTWTTRPATWRR